MGTTPVHSRLISKWDRFWSSQKSETKSPRLHEIFNDLIARYDGEGRHYHNLVHLDDVLEKLSWAKEALEQSGALAHLSASEKKDMFTAIEIALWYHDAVYNPQRKDNEEKSRDLLLADAADLGLSAAIIDQAARMIEVTAHHKDAATLAEKIMTDCDLAIFGAERATFQRYDDAISAEYSFVPKARYEKARAEALEGFYRQKNIFKTKIFRDRYEALAEENLLSALPAGTRKKEKPITP